MKSELPGEHLLVSEDIKNYSCICEFEIQGRESGWRNTLEAADMEVEFKPGPGGG